MAARQEKNAQLFRYNNRRFERKPAMSLLLDSFALLDCGVAESIALRGEPPACVSGCCTCCTQPIPVTPLEILALRLFVELELPPSRRDALKTSFALFRGERATLWGTCPFLLEKRCCVYPVRPIACRRYVVFGQPCKTGEDATQSRPGDVLHPRQDTMQAALRLTLPWYREQYSLPEHITVEETLAFFRGVTTALQAVPWANYT